VQLVTLDFETFYDTGFSLSRMTTEEYIKDERFQVIGVAIKINEGSTKWYSGSHEEIKASLNTINWEESMALCHNMVFDGAILSWIFDIHPKIYLDTLSMARALHGVNAGGSLKALAERYELGQKGTEVLDAKGKRLEDFQDHELHRYGMYCKNDVELTYALFKRLDKNFPLEELKLIDITIKMFTEPTLRLDDAILISRLEEVKEEKNNLLGTLMSRLECEDEECVRKKLASNKQFAELLTEMGVDVPTKISPTTGKETYALAKNDIGFIELQEHEDIFVQELCAVRLGTKSTMEEARIERFLDIAIRNGAKLPIPLKYYGAHTGRWSGFDKVNFQNLPSRDAKKKALKNAILPPRNHVIINADSSQIEARILVWLAGQDNIVEWYREGRDVYSEFASKIYNRKIDKRNKTERFVGKTCTLGLGYGTGWAKLQHTLKTSPPGADLPDHECQRLVKVYREINKKVIDLWEKCDMALRNIASWGDREAYYLDKHKCVLVTKEGLRLPNGLYIYYPELRFDMSEGKGRYIYNSRRGIVSIWGGSVVENVVQALARIVIGEQMIKINEVYKPVLTVHDAVVCVAAKDKAQEALDFIMAEMSKPPEWGKDLPIACEGGFADNYGDC
jgi:DNA polymerase I-like protein with 3'-5' exonuclease and polymerase domains